MSFARHRTIRTTAGFTVATTLLALLHMPGAAAATAVTASADPVALGRALAADVSWVTGAAFVARPGAGSPTGLVSGGVAGLPTSGAAAALLTTGDVNLVTQPNTSDSSGADLGGASVRGNTDFDVTVLRVDLQVPATSNCLVGMDFRFLSEEFPEYVGSRYNDGFIAELDRSTWTTNGSQISAPDNFAFDPAGRTITINAAGETSMTAEGASGTTYDGATPLLTAATPISPGPHSLYLSIFDQGDGVYDSAVIVDNLRLGRVSDVANDCKPGAKVVDRTRYVALGDSYSSGFGVSPYDQGTHKDGTANDCQRSTRAYSKLVADVYALNRSFHACQGAVTRDMYHPRNATWGEGAQLDHLDGGVGLVTYSIGGNDAKFADVLAECILGFELLPFNTCYNDDKVKKPVQQAFDRLDGRSTSPAEVVPYATLNQDIRRRAGTATGVAVGYPHFYPAAGNDRTFLPGGRCEGVKKADQRWMVEKIDELNAIIERNARRNGFLFANPNPRFDGHELCGKQPEWIYPLLSGGKFHPTADGQAAIAESVKAALADDGFTRFVIRPGQKVTYSIVVGGPRQFLSVVTGWPGSDVALTLRAPSGRMIDRAGSAQDVTRDIGPTWEHVEVAAPEVGTWTVEITGVDVAEAGEPVTLSSYQAEPLNQRPVARVSTRIDGDSIVLDAGASADPDGAIGSYAWYISSTGDDEVAVGRSIRIPRAGAEGRTATLVVTDDRGLTDFVELRWLRIDVLPGSSVNPIKRTSQGVTPVAVLSGPGFDATKLDPATLRLGPGGATPVKKLAAEDVDGDGDLDLMLHFDTQRLGLTSTTTQLCLDGRLPDGEVFSGCDAVRVQ